MYVVRECVNGICSQLYIIAALLLPRDELAAAAKAKGVSSYIVHDAGKTQLAPNTATVLAVGPGEFVH